MNTSFRLRGALVVVSMLALAPVNVGTAGSAVTAAELVSSSPSNGSVLDSSPSFARLMFTEKVKPIASGVQLRSAEGEIVDTGRAHRTDKTVVLPIRETLEEGAYLLSYQVSSDDGRTVKGEIVFSVEGAQPTQG